MNELASEVVASQETLNKSPTEALVGVFSVSADTRGIAKVARAAILANMLKS